MTFTNVLESLITYGMQNKQWDSLYLWNAEQAVGLTVFNDAEKR